MEIIQTEIEVPEQPTVKEKPKKPETTQLNVRIAAEIAEYAKTEAERLGVSQAELVTTVIQDYQARHVAEVHPNFASDKDSFDSHLRQVVELYTTVIGKYNTLREDIEREVQEELDKRKAEIDNLKTEAKELKIRAEKAEAEAKETAALRVTIDAKDATIADKDAIIAANANLATRLDEALAKADAADQSERELQVKLADTDKALNVAQSKIAMLTEQAKKSEEDAEKRLQADKSDADERITALKAEHQAALEKAEIEAVKALEKADAASDKRISEAKADAAERIAKLEAEIAAKDSKIEELYSKIAELSRVSTTKIVEKE